MHQQLPFFIMTVVGKLFPRRTQLYPEWCWGETEGEGVSVE